MMTMKVAIVNSAFHPRIVGGIESYLSNVVPTLAQHVTIVVITGPLGVGHPTKSDGFLDHLRVHELDLGNRYPIWDWRNHSAPARALWQMLDARDPSVERQLMTCLKEEDPDVVHTNNLRALSLSALRLPARLGIHHVHTLHDFLLLSPSSNLGFVGLTISADWIPNRIYQTRTRILTRKIGSVVAPSKYILDEHSHRGFFPDSSKFVLRMPRVSRVTNREISIPLETEGLSSYPRPWFLFVGILEESKGVKVLLHAIRTMPLARATFHFAGAGRLTQLLSKSAMVDPRIKFHGELPNAQLPWLYKHCDALIFPSVGPENSPMVLYEALSFGLPVIASKVGGVPELISQGIGVLIKPGSVQDLAGAISRTIENYGREAVTRTENIQGTPLPSLEQHVWRLIEIYKMAAGVPASGR